MQTPIIFIVGPTAVGKSEIGLLLASRWNGEIINADAMQIYRAITIASDKPSLEDLNKVRHHVIDVADVTEVFNVARFRQLALAAIDDIRSRGKTPVVVGGSGMYIKVLLDGIFKNDGETSIGEDGGVADVRGQLEHEAQTLGAPALHERLLELDPKAAAKIHPHDAKRIVRALEVRRMTGQPISSLQPQRDGLWGKVPIKIFGINRDREVLYQRVEARVDAMIDKGLVDEIRAISHLPLSRTASTLIGIQEILGYLRGEHDLARAVYLMKRNTRHLVKKQITWFKQDKRIVWQTLSEGRTAQDAAQELSIELSV